MGKVAASRAKRTKDPKDFDSAVEAIAPVLFMVIEAHKSAQDDHLRQYWSHMAYQMCQQMERFCPPRISAAALREAERLGIRDAASWRWRDQAKYDRGRKVFHFEHKEPVSQMRNKLLQADGEVTLADVKETLRKSSVVWILKEEDRRLTANGHASRREDSDAAYCAAGIEVISADIAD